MQYNTKQQEAILKKDGPLLIIAGAGSGKTATLTARIAHMITEAGVMASSILALTFTNKAAREMKDRTAKLIGAEYRPSMMQNKHLPYIGTFHSFGIFLLKEALSGVGTKEIYSGEISEILSLKKDFLIYDETDKQSLLKNITKQELQLIEKDFPPRKVAAYISEAKNKGLSAGEYLKEVHSPFTQAVYEIYIRYEKRLAENNAIDFDDILTKTLLLLQQEEILAYYQERYTYIMIDEYQDTNLIQYRIVSLLANRYRNLAVVGDDWQSIYSWRGADMRNILNFQKDYPEAHIVKLEQNYRSTKNIIQAANVLITNNQKALKKELWTENIQGEKIHYFEAIDDNSEANFIAESIEEQIQMPISSETGINRYCDNLILYRTNAQSRRIEEALIKKGIPYIVVGGLKFYERKEIKDMLAYLRLIYNPNDSIAFLRIINTPSRKIGAKTLETLTQLKENYGLHYTTLLEDIQYVEDIRPQAREALQNFYEIFIQLQEASTQRSLLELTELICESISYDAYLRHEFSPDEYESKRENLQEFKNICAEYAGMNPQESLAMFLEEVSLISDLEHKLEDNPEESSTNAQKNLGKVTLMTIHTSKGLEQNCVFVTGLEEGLFPSSRSIADPQSLEEERRLMYVAMTRAKEKLFLTRAKERFYFGEYLHNPESRFLKEIPEQYIEKNTGNNIAFFETQMENINLGERNISLIKKPKQYNNVADFRVGMRVSHHKFQVGIIESLLGENAEIRFKDGIKKMNIRIAPLKIITDS